MTFVTQSLLLPLKSVLKSVLLTAISQEELNSFIIAGDRRSPQPIFGQQHSFNCNAGFFPNLSTFLECPCFTD